MNKEAVKENLKLVFLKEKEARKMRKLRFNAEYTETEADESLNEAKGLLRKSIEESQKVYVTIEGKFYKVTPDKDVRFNIFIEEIEPIK